MADYQRKKSNTPNKIDRLHPLGNSGKGLGLGSLIEGLASVGKGVKGLGSTLGGALAGMLGNVIDPLMKIKKSAGEKSSQGMGVTPPPMIEPEAKSLVGKDVEEMDKSPVLHNQQTAQPAAKVESATLPEYPRDSKDGKETISQKRTTKRNVKTSTRSERRTGAGRKDQSGVHSGQSD